jgi:hypothetical protein
MFRFFLHSPLLFISFFGLSLQAQQTQRSTINIDLVAKETWQKDHSTLYVSKVYPILHTYHAEPFLAYAFTQDELLVQLEVRFSDHGEQWTDWVSVEADAHQVEADGQWVSQLQFTEPHRHYFQYRWRYLKDGQQKPEVELHLYSPGKSKITTASSTNSIEQRSCPCPQPDFQSREDWCPNGNCPRDATPAPHNVTHMIIHHSAGANGQEDWAAVVRSIWDFHVNTRGWDDIGYNWLVDADGVLYEGRGVDAIGAHFCGQNTGTEAICVIGDYTFIPPTLESISTVVQWLAWKSCAIDAYPIDRVFHASSGRNLLQVSGHRDGCSTACPGESFYPLLDEVRAATIQYRDNTCSISSLLSAPYALEDSVVSGASVVLNWVFDLNSSNIELVLERSVDENFRYEELARLSADTRTYEDATIEEDNTYFYRIRAESNGEASAYSNIVLVSTFLSNQKNIWQTDAIQLMPNPVASLLYLQIDDAYVGAVQGSIFSADGRLLRSYLWQKEAVFWQVDLNVQELISGLYFLRLESEEGVKYVRFLRE